MFQAAEYWCRFLGYAECRELSAYDASLVAGATVLACFAALLLVSTALATVRDY